MSHNCLQTDYSLKQNADISTKKASVLLKNCDTVVTEFQSRHVAKFDDAVAVKQIFVDCPE